MQARRTSDDMDAVLGSFFDPPPNGTQLLGCSQGVSMHGSSWYIIDRVPSSQIMDFSSFLLERQNNAVRFHAFHFDFCKFIQIE